jgi:hypothetical protein
MTLDQLLDTPCPIFWEPHESGRKEQIGSGVLLQIKDEVFLLTAAHVTDASETGTLLLPGRDGITLICGHFAHIPVPRGGKRSDDKADIAYFRLSEDLRTNLDPSLLILTRDDILLCDQLLDGDLYTFAGYPWRKSQSQQGKIVAEPFTFTGGAASGKDYEKLGYSRTVHIVVKFRRRKSFSVLHQAVKTAPRPGGISGGGVFAWPKDLQERTHISNLKLVGIAHTYHEDRHCMAGTRINTYLACILQNNPGLGTLSDPAYEQPQLFTGIVWYKKEEWEEFLASADDADTMHPTWAEWRQAALELLEKSAASGVVLTPTEITVKEIEEYCRSRGVKNTAQARSELASIKVAAMIQKKPAFQMQGLVNGGELPIS